MLKKMLALAAAPTIAAMAFVAFTGHPVSGVQRAATAKRLEYPKPRYPKIPKITAVEQLVPYARKVLTRRPPTADAGLMHPSYGLKGGERVLFVVSENIDPLVVEAFAQSLAELNCKVELRRLSAGEPKLDVYSMYEADSMENWIKGQREGAGFGVQRSTAELRELAKNYDITIGAVLGNGRSQRMPWTTRELLASAGAQFPPELNGAINRAAWNMLRTAYKVRLTDPEGTDLTFTWHPEYWQVMEGTHHAIKTRGTSTSNNYGAGFIYGKAGVTENPLFSNHLMGVPDGIVLENSDAEGVVVATTAHQGPFPWIRLTIKNHRIVKIENGGRYGDAWRRYLEKFKDLRYPLFPKVAAGVGFWIEAAIGTNPKAYRPHNVMESAIARDAWSEERKRSGIIHMGFGNALVENAEWARRNNLPGGHYHLHLYFPTYTIQTRDGKQIKLIDKGRLTALDDPEVRRVAAKYGNPDELLREDWIPAIPGINVPGDYFKYANDPAAWIIKEHRKAYGDMLDFKPYP